MKTKTQIQTQKIALVSLGCSKNLVDSEKMLGRLAQGEVVFCQDPALADVLIINTCGFVKDAKEESINTILEMAKLKEECGLEKLIVTGCLAERYEKELIRDIPEIDHVVELENFDRIAELSGITGREKGSNGSCDVSDSFRVRLTPRHYAYLKISEGCSNSCSYCAIPAIRGPFGSRPMDEILREAEGLAAGGARELNLIAQDSTLYGVDIYGRQCLHELLGRLSKIDPIKWIRLLYTHPAHFYPELIGEIAGNERVVKYVDMPVQHISDKMLELMGREVTRSRVEELIRRLRKEIPGLVLRTTMIVGFPGEGEREFRELLAFLEETAFERLGAFVYSQEEGTPAAAFKGRVPEPEKQRRLAEVMTLQQGITFDKNDQLVGKNLEVLVDGVQEGGRSWLARSYRDAPEVDGNVIVFDTGLVPGEFKKVTITHQEGYDLVANCV